MTFTYTNAGDENVWAGDVCIRPSQSVVKNFRAASFEQAVKNGSLTLTIDGSIEVPESGLTVVFDRNEHGMACHPVRFIKKGTTITLPEPEPTDELIFGGWFKDRECTQPFTESDAVNENMTLYPLWAEGEFATYEVVHKQEALDGSFVVKETETLRGIVGKNTKAVAKNYPGFTAGTVEQTEIQESGTQVVIEYTRNEITVTFNLAGGTTTTPLDEGNTLTAKFGAALEIADPTLEGSTFTGWTPQLPETFPAQNTTYAAGFQQSRYYGWADGETVSITAELVKGLANVSAATQKGLQFVFDDNEGQEGHVVYAYPAALGDLTSIRDEVHSIDYTGSFTKSTVTIGTVEYNVYCLTDSVTPDAQSEFPLTFA